MIRLPVSTVRAQSAAILAAWGMPADQVRVTAERMTEADVSGIDSHGIAMLGLYEEHLKVGKIVIAPTIQVVRDGPATALIDGGGGLGHVPATQAMELAIAKAKAIGVGAVGVYGSHHFGAAGVYALMAARQGLLGIATSGVHDAAVVPTFAAEAMFGTNPFAFAAPATRHPPFLFDMATSTVAIGKLKLAELHGKPIAPGWAMDDQGSPTTDPTVGLKSRRLTPIGGTREMSSHKGYGMGAMVEILSTMLTGAFYPKTRARRHPEAVTPNVGHFLLALDPDHFRSPGAFEDDLDDLIEALHGARRADPDQPVLVHGDPEWQARAEREANGIPLPDGLVAAVQAIAARAGAPYLLSA